MKSYGNRLEKADIPVTAKEQFTHGMLKVLNEKWHGISAPDCARDIQSLYRSVVNDPDPYREVKRESNDTVLDMYNDLEELVRNSADPFITAMKLAIAGNIIDFAVHDHCDLHGTIEKVLNSDFAVDHTSQLMQAFSPSRYLISFSSSLYRSPISVSCIACKIACALLPVPFTSPGNLADKICFPRRKSI